MLMLVVTIGIVAVDRQINSLTQKQEFSQILNLRRNPSEGYQVYLFGERYSLGGVFPVARIENEGDFLSVTAGGVSIRLPVRIRIEYTRALEWLHIWGRQFREEAEKTGASLGKQGKNAFEDLKGYLRQLRSLLRGESSK